MTTKGKGHEIHPPGRPVNSRFREDGGGGVPLGTSRAAISELGLWGFLLFPTIPWGPQTAGEVVGWGGGKLPVAGL